jgi:hypothetical protein
MASSSRPFQSHTVSRLLAGYRQLAHGAERWLRQGRTALLWGVQVTLYPAYIALQSVRTASRKMQAAQPWQQVVAWFTGHRPQPRLVSSDMSIRALLSVIQPQVARQPGGITYGDRHGELLRQSRAESVLTNGQWQQLPLQGPVRAVASALATRKLVLVTADHGIFDQLTDDQQDRLHRAIVLLLAEYANWCRRQWHDRQLQAPGLPLPQAETTQWLPVRWLNQTLSWMQTSPLAIATNLFGEADAPQSQLAADRSLPLQISPLEAGLDRSRSWYGEPSYPAQVFPPHRDAPHPSTNASISLASASGLLAASRWPLAQPRDHQAVATSVQPALEVEAGEGWARRARVPGVLEEQPRRLPGTDAIEAQVTLVNYVDHPLVVVLRWLDALIHSTETWLRGLWTWLRVHL